MTILSTIKTLLEGDMTLAALATGGIFDLSETGPNGINRTTTTGAFDSAGIIKPCILLKSRGGVPDYALADDTSQMTSLKEAIECWLYQDAAYDQITAMGLRIYALLHAKTLSGTFVVYWAGDTQPFRDLDLDAFGVRSQYTAVAKRSV